MTEYSEPIVARVLADIRGFKASMGEAGREAKKLADGGSSHFARLASVGKAAAITIGTSAIGIGAASVKMAADFQEGMTTLVTGAGESEKNIAAVRNGILRLAVATGTSTKQLTDGMYLIESAGYHGAQGLSVLKAAAQGAKVGNADLGTVAGAVTTVLHDYHLAAGNAASVTSALVQTVASGKTHMEDLGRALGAVLPLASSLGVSFPQVAGAMATMTNAGMNARRSAMMLNNTLRSLAAPSGVAMSALTSVGLTAQQVKDTLSTKGLTGALQLVQDAIGSKFNARNALIIFDQLDYAAQKLAAHQKMTASETAGFQRALGTAGLKAADFKAAIDLRGVAGAMQLLEGHMSKTMPSSSVAAVEAFKNILGGATGYNVALMLGGKNMAAYQRNVASIGGVLNKHAKDVQGMNLVQKDFNFKLAQARQAIETTAIRLGTLLIPWVERAAKAVAGLSGFFVRHRTIALAVGAAIGGVLTLAITAYVAQLTKAGYKSIVEFGKMIRGAVKWAVTTTASVVEAAAAWITANAGMMASAVASAAAILIAWAPLILTIGAIGLAVYELYQHWDQVWGFITGTAARAWALIKRYSGYIVLALAVIALPIAILIETAIQLYKHWDQVWAGIKAVTSAVWNDVLKPVFTALGDAFRVIGGALSWLYRNVWLPQWNAIRTVAGEVWTGLKVVFGFYEGAFKGIGRALSWLANTVWYPLWDGIRSAVEFVWSIIKPIFDKIKDAIGFIGKGIGAIGKAAGAIGGAVGHVAGFLGFDTGGVVPGPVGAPRIAVVHGGETILPTHKAGVGPKPIPAASSGSGSGGDVHIHFDGPVYGANADELARQIANSLNRISGTGGILRPFVLTPT
jgi:hypothetical protein